ncbi:hypothetical protein MMC07_002075 [Pseudocyphellaria aurata]|nr:hypothetical protein [Pseudocyphellaria aurata]
MGRVKKSTDPKVAAAAARKARADAKRAKAVAELRAEEFAKARAKAKAEAKIAAELASEEARWAKIKLAVAKRKRSVCGFLITFWLRYHSFSVESIFRVFQAYGIEGGIGDIAKCIEENGLLSYKYPVPHDEDDPTPFRIEMSPAVEVRMRHPKHIVLTMTHPEIPALFSPCLVLSDGPHGMKICTKVFEKRLEIGIMIVRGSYPYPMKRLGRHWMRIMHRALMFPVPPRASA